MNLKEYLAFVAANEEEIVPKKNPSANSYGQPNILQLETDRLYKEDGEWCYKAAE